MYNNNTKLYEFVNKLQYGGSAILLTRDVVGIIKRGSQVGYVTISPNFESSDTNNPTSWYNSAITRSRKVQPFFYI